jgi:hypothetical protein
MNIPDNLLEKILEFAIEKKQDASELVPRLKSYSNTIIKSKSF